MSTDPEAWAVSAQLTQSMSFADYEPPTIVINGMDRQPLVTINPDGTLDYGPDYNPDEAARIFWDSLRRYMGARCTNCGHDPAPDGEADNG